MAPQLAKAPAPDRSAGAASAVAALQERVLGQLLVDGARELDVRQLQQLDRLLQLRREHKALLLPKIEADAGAKLMPAASEAEPVAEIDPAHGGIGDDLAGVPSRSTAPS